MKQFIEQRYRKTRRATSYNSHIDIRYHELPRIVLQTQDVDKNQRRTHLCYPKQPLTRGKGKCSVDIQYTCRGCTWFHRCHTISPDIHHSGTVHPVYNTTAPQTVSLSPRPNSVWDSACENDPRRGSGNFPLIPTSTARCGTACTWGHWDQVPKFTAHYDNMPSPIENQNVNPTPLPHLW